MGPPCRYRKPDHVAGRGCGQRRQRGGDPGVRQRGLRLCCWNSRKRYRARTRQDRTEDEKQKTKDEKGTRFSIVSFKFSADRSHTWPTDLKGKNPVMTSCQCASKTRES